MSLPILGFCDEATWTGSALNQRSLLTIPLNHHVWPWGKCLQKAPNLSMHAKGVIVTWHLSTQKTCTCLYKFQYLQPTVDHAHTIIAFMWAAIQCLDTKPTTTVSPPSLRAWIPRLDPPKKAQGKARRATPPWRTGPGRHALFLIQGERRLAPTSVGSVPGSTAYSLPLTQA